MKNVLALSAKNDLIPLGLMASASATDAAYSKAHLWIMHNYTEHFEQRNEQYHENKYFEKSGLLNKRVSKAIENKAKRRILWHVIRYISS